MSRTKFKVLSTLEFLLEEVLVTISACSAATSGFEIACFILVSAVKMLILRQAIKNLYLVALKKIPSVFIY